MILNNIQHPTRLHDFHLVMPKKKFKQLCRIAKQYKMPRSVLIRKIFTEYRHVIYDKHLFCSPKRSKCRRPIVNKIETRFNIYQEDYDFLSQAMFINNYGSRAEFFREIIIEYIDRIIDSGRLWFEQQRIRYYWRMKNKIKILKGNKTFIHKIADDFECQYNLLTNGATAFDIQLRDVFSE